MLITLVIVPRQQEAIISDAPLLRCVAVGLDLPPSKQRQLLPATFVISGAGIVGLSLALSLYKHTNIRPEVYEKRSADAFHQCVGAGMGM